MQHFFLVLFVIAVTTVSSVAADRPNVLWFVVDDMSANFSSYGETLIQTPAVDKLAAEGTRFTRAYVTAPVCSACRSAMITGMYQTTIGAHHHRSGRGTLKISLPEGVEPVPALFQKAGYYTCIGSGVTGPKQGKKKTGLGKTDYNFEYDAAIYDSDDWAARKAGQPFFMQVQLSGGKQRGGTDDRAVSLSRNAEQVFGKAVQPNAVTLPPYYPRDPVLLRDWAAYLEAVRLTDQHVGRVIDRLQKEGLLENTLVIFMTDHGISHARGKQFLYDEGTHVPFVVRGPGIEKGAVRTDLIQQIDMAALSLSAAGIPIPATMQGKDIFAKGYQPREAVYAARDRCDETVERIRSVRTERFLYIRNFHPERPHMQPNAYKDGKTIVQTLRSLHEAGKLPALSEQLLFSPTRPSEELYEYAKDRWQITNLATKPEYRAELESHRARLDQWMASTQDKGPESNAMYDSDMVEYLKKDNAEVLKNIAVMKQWAKDGK